MYIPSHFACSEAEVYELLSEMGGVEFVTCGDGGLESTFMPMLYLPEVGEHGVLRGHLARVNAQARSNSDRRALVVVHGPDSYVSPSYYPSKAEHGKVVPTWNYLTVHLYGEYQVLDDPEWVEQNVRGLTDKHEQLREHPWCVDDAPREYIEAMLRAIVGVEIMVSRIEAKSKMSQNRPPQDVEGVIAGLSAIGDYQGAAAVQHARELRN